MPLAPAEAFLLARYGPMPADAHPLDEAPYDADALPALANARLVHAGHPSWHLARREGDRLGEILVYRGWLTSEQVEAGLRQPGLLGEALIGLGSLRPGQLQLALQWQQRYRSQPRPAPRSQPFKPLLERVLVEPDPFDLYEAALAALDLQAQLDLPPEWFLEAARRGDGQALGVLAYRELEFLPRMRTFSGPDVVRPLELAVIRAVAARVLEAGDLAPTLRELPGPGDAPTLGGSR